MGNGGDRCEIARAGLQISMIVLWSQKLDFEMRTTSRLKVYIIPTAGTYS